MSGYRETSQEDSNLGTGCPLTGVGRTRGVDFEDGTCRVCSPRRYRGEACHWGTPVTGRDDTTGATRLSPTGGARTNPPYSPTDEWGGRGGREYRGSGWRLDASIGVGD